MWVEHPVYRGYLINHEGCVVSLRKGIWRELSQSTTYKGYRKVEIYSPLRVRPLVHRLVMQVFYGISDLQVNHIDGDKENNAISNLEYVTARDNNLHYQANKAKYRELLRSKYFSRRK